MNQHPPTSLDTSSRSQYPDDDEISLIDLINILRNHWKLICFFAFAAPLIAFAITLSIPRLYQAEVLIQVGRIAGAGAADIEPPATVAQRLNSDGFLQLLKGQVDTSFSVKAVEIKNTKLLRLEGRAATPTLAQNGVEQVLEVIAKDHNGAIESVRKKLSEELSSAEQELKIASHYLDRLNRTVIALSKEGTQDAMTGLLLTQTQSQLTNQRISLQDKVASIKTAMQPQNLVFTQAVEPIKHSKNPVYPKVAVVVLIAFLGGAFAGVLAAFLKNALIKRQGNPPVGQPG